MKSTLAFFLTFGLAVMTPAAAQDELAEDSVEPGESALLDVDSKDPSLLAVEPMKRATGALLLAVAEGDQRAIAVGERGHIVVSESRQDWRQVLDVPTRSTLTAVDAVGNSAWAVGHDQVILHSSDGGLTWVRQRAQPFNEDNLDDPRNGAPFLGVLFLDQHSGFAVGAYGLMMRTDDGGENWRAVPITAGTEAAAAAAATSVGDPDRDEWTFSDEDLELDAESDPHLNAIVRTGDGSLFVAAERGAAFRSTDKGNTWERIQLPYEGSMFGAIGYASRRVLVFGLRGNALESDDLGDSWRALDTGTELSLQGGAALGESGAVIVGNDGLVLVRGEDGEVKRRKFEPGGVLSDVLPIGGSGQLVLAGEHGLNRFLAQ